MGDQAARGELLWEYHPPAAHPILQAGILVAAAVAVLGSLENLARENRPFLYAIYWAVPLGLLLLQALLRPGPVRIHEGGIALSRPLLLRWRRPFAAWDSLAAVYPVHYDVTGAFVSPFASSDGKVTQMGLGLERAGGGVEVVRFTPTRFALWQPRSRGYREAIEVVRSIHARQGRPLVRAAPRFTPEQRKEMMERARRPFLPFIAIVLLMASAAPVLAVLARLGVPLPVAIPVACVPPVAVCLRSLLASRARFRILNALSKSAEAERAAAGTGAPAATPSAPQPTAPAPSAAGGPA